MDGNAFSQGFRTVGVIIAFLFALFFGAGVLLGIAVGREQGLAESPFRTACKTEDSTACHWRADQRGNGEGRSFVVDRNGTIYYEEK